MTRTLYRITFEYRNESSRSYVFEATPDTVETTVASLRSKQFSSLDYYYIEHAPLVLGDVVMELVTF